MPPCGIVIAIAVSILIGVVHRSTCAPTDSSICAPTAVPPTDSPRAPRTPSDYSSFVRGCFAHLFESENYEGRSVLVWNKNANLADDGLYARISSAQIEGKCNWIFYGYHSFAASSSNYIISILRPGKYPSTVLWGHFDNQLGSLRAIPPEDTLAILLFDYDYFKGRMVALFNSTADLARLDFDNRASSMIVLGGEWKVYNDKDFRGTGITYRTGYYYKRKTETSTNTVSSVKRV